MEQTKTFAELFTGHMARVNLSDQDLADALGLRRETVYRWRIGSIKAPREKTIRKSGGILKLSAEESDELLLVAAKERERYATGMHKTAEVMAEAPLPKFTVSEADRIVPVPTRPVEHPRQFFGHKKLIERIFQYWNGSFSEHILITGPRRSGKTSLLHYLKNIHHAAPLRKNQRNDWLARPYNWVFVDFSRMRMQRRENLLRYILAELNLPEESAKDLISFSETLEDDLDKQSIILMDNIEDGLKAEGLDMQFWQFMRNLREFGPVGLCGTSRLSVHELHEFAKKHGKTSPFFNVFLPVELGPLHKEEGRELLSHVTPPLVKADADWIINKSGGWPVLLQNLCAIRMSSVEKEWKAAAGKIIDEYQYLTASTARHSPK